VEGGSGDSAGEIGVLEVKTGEMMFSGYLLDDEATAAAFTSDGFYRLGDVVRVTRVAEGALAGRHRVVVLGRAKSTVKLSNGHWIFSETLEDVYRTCAGDPKIEYVMIHGDARHSQLVAVVDVGGAWDGASKTREDLEEELLRRLQAHAAAMGQAAHEFVGAVVLARTPFSRFSDPQTLNGTGK